MPEALAIVLLGGLIGFLLSYSRWDWRQVESFNVNLFFLVLLPPIIVSLELLFVFNSLYAF